MTQVIGYKSLLQEMTQTTPTCLWNDSAAVAELTPSIEQFGAVGATCNPVIVLDVLKQEMQVWKERIKALIAEMPTATEDQIGWRLVEEISINSAKLLKPAFDQYKGRNGRLSVQTDPRNFRNPKAMADQAVHFSGLAPNIVVKIPVTKSGVEAIEDATYRGVSINATVSFTLPQAIAVAEAVERGLERREKEGKDISTMGPVCTIMVGRLDDWIRLIGEKKGITTAPGAIDWAGVAVFKKAYRLYRERGYRIRLLSAAFRSHMHWSEFVGGDVVISPPYKWQIRCNNSGLPIVSRIETPVDPRIVDELLQKFPDFERAYEENGLAPEEFDTYGATRRTLRQFIQACSDLGAQIREIMIPNPDNLI